ncbi:MAG: hypothetical protein F6K56_40305, partial [Moorea sp. SIO3G5]|nr:hypothetical protein [Moorena sp. SIO3G5]
TFNLTTLAKRPRNRVQPWPKGHAIAFNLQPDNLGLWPRNRVQPST